ncbi:SdrD B-like domain-containing protein [Methanolobus sp. ZRKC2]|uniref:SdrD B-like domain-containing protein n=1 Tax=Methanolobus sp. ZRKC2 TaxID=3125783 RepID=UPI003249626D
MSTKDIHTGSFPGKVARVALFTIFVLIAFTFQASACHVGDKVWNDLNLNGIQDDGEPGIEGVEVKLFRHYNNGTVSYIESTTTDEDGKYNFSVRYRKCYHLQFELPEGYAFTSQDQGTHDYLDSDVNITTGETKKFKIWRARFYKKWDAGMYELASVGNFVWKDVNNNGVQDQGEPGTEGVTVELYDCTGEFVASTNTDSTGFYEFTGLLPGSYYMKFILPDGYVFAPYGQGGDPASDSDAGDGGVTPCFDLSAGEYNEIIDAGLFTHNEEIPEFPTIALPMAAILGLAFVFQRRKE